MGKISELFKLVEENKLNIATVPLKKARSYAEEKFRKAGKELSEEIPDFDKNYMSLQKAMKKAVDIPRIDMPVIEPDDINKFENDIVKGKVDIFRPLSKGHKVQFPKDLLSDPKKAKEFLTLGHKDGDTKDDRIKAKVTRMEADKLLPTQSQIWLEKVIDNIIDFGLPKSGSPISEATLIVSREGYILDGHHRYGQAMIGNPSLKMRSLYVPMDIDLLLRMGRSYGNAIGNKQKQ